MNIDNNNSQPTDHAMIKIVYAADLLKWLEEERTLLFNTAAYMLEPVEYRNTMDIVNAINKTLEYIELSKICR